MLIELGCGSELKKDHLNIDGYGKQFGTKGGTRRMVCDLRRGIPRIDLFNDPIENAERITHCHFIEHLTTPEAIELTKECYRVLAPGGVLRMGIPNYPRMFKAYLENDYAYLAPNGWNGYPEETRDWIDIVEYGVFQRDDNGYENHKSLWSIPKILRILNYIGFKNAREVPYDSNIEPNNELRKMFTFVVSASK